jgi:plasmid maintenance system antidote protein VapI
MSIDFWMSLQLQWDLHHAQQEEMPILKKNDPVRTL